MANLFVVTIEAVVDLDQFTGEQLDEIHHDCHGSPCETHDPGPVDEEWLAEEIALEGRRFESVSLTITDVKRTRPYRHEPKRNL